MALLRLVCALLPLTALTAALVPARVHEARQGPIQSTSPLSLGPGPASLPTSSTANTSTMSPTSTTSESSSSSSSDPSPLSPYPPGPSTLGSSASSATPQPSSSLNITAYNMTTCTSGLISWKYSGDEAELFLSVTNLGVDQNDYASPRMKARQNTGNNTFSLPLADTNTSALNWTWPSVNLTQGWYMIEGLALVSPSVADESAPFFIANGTNITCLTGAAPQPSSTATSTPSPSPAVAVTKSHVGSIIGGVIGGVAGVLIVAGLWFWSRKRKRPFAGEALNTTRKWGSLKSTTSSIQPITQHDGNHFHSNSDATTATLADVPGSRRLSSTTTPSRSDDDVTSATGEEKLASPSSSHGMSPFDALNTPVPYDRRASTCHVSTPTTVSGEDSRSRTTSLHTSNQSLEQQAQRIRSSMETSMRRRSERLSMPTLPSPALARLSHSPTTHAPPGEEYPLSHVTTMPVNRSISSGGMSTTRRTARKPVPQYDPSTLQEDANNADSVSTFTGGAESSHSHGTGAHAGTLSTPTDLVHSPGFGDGRPVHYLIPDMPPPQHD